MLPVYTRKPRLATRVLSRGCSVTMGSVFRQKRDMSHRNGGASGGVVEAETIANINCGGRVFQTTVSTLRADDQSKLYDMFGAKNLGTHGRRGGGRTS